MSINIYTAYELHVFHEEKRIPTFHELFNQFFQPEARKVKKNVLYHIVNQHLHSPFVYTNNEVCSIKFIYSEEAIKSDKISIF